MSENRKGQCHSEEPQTTRQVVGRDKAAGRSRRARLYKKLLALCDLRLDADYRALPVGLTQAHEGLFTVGEIVHVITQHKIL
jgi:hypothetical protein